MFGPNINYVFGEQRFLEKPKDIEVIEGQDAILRCKIAERAGQVQVSKSSIINNSLVQYIKFISHKVKLHDMNVITDNSY